MFPKIRRLCYFLIFLLVFTCWAHYIFILDYLLYSPIIPVRWSLVYKLLFVVIFSILSADKIKWTVVFFTCYTVRANSAITCTNFSINLSPTFHADTILSFLVKATLSPFQTNLIVFKGEQKKRRKKRHKNTKKVEVLS